MGILLEVEIGRISEVQRVKNYSENQNGQKVKILRSDNIGEYTFTEFKAYLGGKVIEH